MSRWCLAFPAFFLAATAFAQIPLSPVDIANLQEDVRGLKQQVSELSLQVEQLQHQQPPAATLSPGIGNYATVVQLNQAVADLNRAIQIAVTSAQTDTIAQVNVQLQKVTKQVNAALAGGGRKAETATAAPAGDGSFSADYPKTGESYTVQKGDTLALIAKKLGAKRQDIINANKISDPSRIKSGDTLFIPEAK